MEIIGITTYAMDILTQVDALPSEDGFAVVTGTSYLPGGSGTNVLVQAARLGANCRFLGKVGDDPLGKDILKNLVSESINISDVLVMENGTSLHTNIVVDRNGRKFILLNMGNAFTGFLPEDINEGVFKQGNVYYSDLLPYPAARKGFRLARAAGMKTAFNLQVGLETMSGFGVTKEMILDTLKEVDLFAPCRDGLYALCHTRNLKECLTFLRPYFAGTLVVTLGDQGAVVFDSQDRRFDQPVRKVKVVDTTGAGDSFMGAMLAVHLVNEAPLPEALCYAAVCASETCAGIGARCGPDRTAVEKILRQEAF